MDNKVFNCHWCMVQKWINIKINLTSALRTILNQVIISWPQTLLSGSEIETERVGCGYISSFVQSHKRARQTDRHKMAFSRTSIFILRKKSRGSKEWHFVKSDWFTALMLLSDSFLYLIHPCISVTNIIATGTLYRTRFGRGCGPVARQTVNLNEWVLLTSLRLHKF